MPKIKEEKIIYDDHYQIEEATVKNGKAEFQRQRINRQDAAVVLLLNTDTDKVILTRQFRYAISAKTKKPILEIIAGKLDKNEKALKAAVRETEEEAGYRVSKKSMRYVFSFFVSPGYTSEKFHFFYAEVKNEDKKGKGGGLQDENEDIEVVELPAGKFLEMAKQGDLEDAKTYIAAMYLIEKLKPGTKQKKSSSRNILAKGK
jgi:nudix-type nucleoside diphosphatase (YffH/AdpP family)